jgi:sterol desaturase/sphingolipid hydroxylase (fatty acid hydroxylase superfamily)
MIGFALGLLHANAVEWVTHKYVLHGLGKRKGSMWRFHWAQHHRAARKHGMYDKAYEEPPWKWSAGGKETAGIALLAAVHLPLVTVAPYFTAGVLVASVNYLYRHRKCHRDVEWGKKHMPAHVAHHMAENQDTNWCVSYPWMDKLLGTYELMAPEALAAVRADTGSASEAARSEAAEEEARTGSEPSQQSDGPAAPLPGLGDAGRITSKVVTSLSTSAAEGPATVSVLRKMPASA